MRGVGDREAYLLDEAAAWAAEGLITPEQYDRLKARYAAPPEEARRRIVVRALLAVGVVLVLAGVGHVLADVHWSAGALALAQAVMAAVCLAIGLKFHRDRPDARSGDTFRMGGCARTAPNTPSHVIPHDPTCPHVTEAPCRPRPHPGSA